jgi:aminoglycoside phosphotransferase (APT) family kinase protein
MASLGRLIGSGKDADVFEWGEAAIKLYKSGAPKHAAYREAAALALAEWLKVPVPSVGDVRQVDGRWGLVLARVDGPSFADVMNKWPAEAVAHLREMVSIQARIHACEATFFGSLKARLEANIRRAPMLQEARRHELLEELTRLPDGDKLCHWDFHPWNILGSLSRPLVVDWTSASRGDPAADVCRSYVLIKPSAPDLASSYVEAYAGTAHRSPQDIFKWLPVVAAARLAEGVPNEVDDLMAMASCGTD